MVKKKVQDIAKELNLEVDYVIDVLSQMKDETNKVVEPKKKTSFVEENDVNYLLNRVTADKNVANFNDYFALTEEIKPKIIETKTEKTSKAPRKTPAKKETKVENVVNDDTKLEGDKIIDTKNNGKKTQNDNKEVKADTQKSNQQPKTAQRPANNNKQNQPNKPQQNKPVNNTQNQNGNKPQQNRPANNTQNQNGNKPQQNKPANNTQNPNGNKPQQNRPANNTQNQNGNKPQQNRPFNNANQNQQPKNNNKPQQNKAPQKQVAPNNNSQKVQSVDNIIENETEKKGVRIIDTRTSNVNIDKYNEKYDKLANEKIKTDNTITKQKLNQRSRQDKARRGKKETESERLKRIAQQRANKPLHLTLPEEMTVGELATALKATAAEVIKKLMLMGSMVTMNDVIDFDTAELVAMEFNAKVEKEVVVTIEDRIIDDSEDNDTNLVPRSPVVVVMGHVDHGKTSLLDAIRQANVTTGEAGGITQHIGAYRTKVGDDEITFLDTPGHAAFTTMRARGAMVTDIAVLVVAADDGIMPQTIEAINHAKAANVSIIVAINKMDKPAANPDKVLQQLTEYGLVPEEWGGETPCVPVSAITKQGIPELLEMIMLVAEMKELKANPDRSAKGTVIEARLDKGRGPIATILVQNGTLKTGDIIVAGTTVGRVRAMTNYKGEKVDTAGPSIPVEITGLDDVPTGGDIFNAVSDERLARELVERRKNEQKEELFNAQTKVTLDNLFDQMKDGEMKELKVIVKADVQGSVEAVTQSLVKLSNEEVRVNVIHGAVGAVSESDVMLASASNAIIVGFNVRPDPVAESNAQRDGVDMRMYRIIYDCIEEIASAMKGMLDPKYREVMLGRAEVRQVYRVTGVGIIAGSYILDGKINRTALLRIVRDGIVIADDKIVSLRRFKDDVKEVAQGYECGIGIEKYSDLKEGDIFECYFMEEYRD